MGCTDIAIIEQPALPHASLFVFSENSSRRISLLRLFPRIE
jgi:hypothetical protein